MQVCAGATVEKWPLVFASPAHAVAFADRFLNDPRVESQLGAMKRRVVQQRDTVPSFDQWGMRVTRSRLRDMAETISASLSECDAPACCLYRHIYGKHSLVLDLADGIAHRVWDGPGARHIKTIGQMRQLARLVIEDKRRNEAYGTKVPVKDMAASIDVTRDAFYDNWIAYVSAMREIINQWLAQTDRQLSLKLEMRGIL